MVCDLERSTVEFIAENCKQTSLERYFTGLAADQVVGIKAIALDMWESYIQAVRAHVPDAGSKLVFDRYHIMTHMGRGSAGTSGRPIHRSCLTGFLPRCRQHFSFWESGTLFSKRQETVSYRQANDLTTLARAWLIQSSASALAISRARGRSISVQ